MLAPICLFTYNRLEETKQTVVSLQANFLAKDSELFVFSDGSKNKSSCRKIQAVRDYLKSIAGFKSVTIYESDVNKGLAKSIIEGVSKLLANNDKVIVMEDDLVSTPNFLNFMNQALNFYQKNKKIISISGYTMNLPSLKNSSEDFYFGFRASSWGWGVWKDRWTAIDWDVNDYYDFIKDKKAIRDFKKGGSDMPRMLRKQMEGKIDSWAIRFCYHQFKNKMLTLFPTISKLESIGISKDATHTSGTKRFITPIDKSHKKEFYFENFKMIDTQLTKEFADFFSIKNRIINQFWQRFNFEK
jgi:GR25 family glycosyltransferase involved in LPS biosynthesis